MALSNTNAKSYARSSAPVDRHGRGCGNFLPSASSVVGAEPHIDLLEFWRRPLLDSDLHLDVATDCTADLYGIHGRGCGCAGYSGHRPRGGVFKSGGDRRITINDQTNERSRAA